MKKSLKKQETVKTVTLNAQVAITKTVARQPVRRTSRIVPWIGLRADALYGYV